MLLMPVVDLVTFQTMGLLLLLHIQARYVTYVCMVRYVAIVSMYVCMYVLDMCSDVPRMRRFPSNIK